MSLKIFPTIILIICWLLLITNISYYSLLLTGVASLGFVFYNMKFYWKYFFFIVIFLFIVLIFLLVIKTVVFENNSSEQWLTVKVVQKYRNYYVVEYQKKYLMIKKYFFNISWIILVSASK
ncbi:hypothetical protein [Spiroplasma endosymbiont of Nephrotoma flavescens]|uniref:hypothetical protein n=1 Tax=Spiroplasma endosymbiont of Nephrotoma flavescens TaxID=3066302 RepID=UPI00313DCECC